MADRIKTFNRDPFIHEFQTSDLVNNQRQGKLFYRSYHDLYLIEACISGAICPKTASNLLVISGATIGSGCSDSIFFNAQLTSSCTISSSEDIIGANITASGGIETPEITIIDVVATGDVVLGTNCDDNIHIKGYLTASCDITQSDGKDIYTGRDVYIPTAGNIFWTGSNTDAGNTVLAGGTTRPMTRILGSGRDLAFYAADDIILHPSSSGGDGLGNVHIMSGSSDTWCTFWGQTKQVGINLYSNSVPPASTLSVHGDIQALSGNTNRIGNITASHNIEAGDTVFAQTGSFHSGSFANLNVTASSVLGDSCADIIELKGQVTASCGISASATSSFGMIISEQIFATELEVLHLTSSFITASTIVTTGSVTFGDNCSDVIKIEGQLTASCGISASKTGSIGNLIVGGDAIFGDNCSNSLTLKSTLTSSCIISTSNGIYGSDITASRSLLVDHSITASVISCSQGDYAMHGGTPNYDVENFIGNHVTLGDDCSDRIHVRGYLTASCGISSSGDIIAPNITASTIIISDNGTLDPTVSENDADAECFIVFVGTDPDGSQQALLADGDSYNDGLRYDTANNRVKVRRIATELIEFQDGDDALEIADGGYVTAVQSFTGSKDISASGDLSGKDLYVDGNIYHGNDTDTKITFTDDNINITVGNVNMLDFTEGGTNEITFNEAGADIDVRVEGAADANLLFTNAGTSKVGIGTNAPSEKLSVSGSLNVFGEHGHITASGNISSSGTDSFIGGNVTLGDDCSDSIHVRGYLTASCGISSSGDIIGPNITASTILVEGGISDFSGDVTLGTDCSNVIVLNGQVTASCGISASATSSFGAIISEQIFVNELEVIHLTASFITASTIVTTGSVTFGDNCSDVIKIEGQLTASCGISASKTGSIGNLIVGGDAIFGSDCSDSLTLKSTLTSSCIISTSNGIYGGDITASRSLLVDHSITASVISCSQGDYALGHGGTPNYDVENFIGNHVTLGDDCSDRIHVRGYLTASCGISSSGDVIAPNITASTFVVSGDGSLNPTISENDADAECFIVFVGTDPDGSQQALLADGDSYNDGLRYDTANNRIKVRRIATENIQFQDGDSALEIIDGGGVTAVKSFTGSHSISASGTGSFSRGLHVGSVSASNSPNPHFVDIRNQNNKNGGPIVYIENVSTSNDSDSGPAQDSHDGIKIVLGYSGSESTNEFVPSWGSLPPEYDTLAATLDGNHYLTFVNKHPSTGYSEVGKVYALPNQGVMYATDSDLRLKDVIGETKYGLEDLLSLKVKDYTWKKSPHKNVDTGLIAQEVIDIYPNAVLSGEEKNKRYNIKEGDANYNYMNIEYSKFVPLLIKSIQEQQEQIDNLKQQIKTLKDGI